MAEQTASRSRPFLEKPRLALVVVDQRHAAEPLRAAALSPSLEACLQVDVRAPSAGARSANLGLLSVMLAPARAELIWTLPDGRTGMARVHANVAQEELLTRLAAVARSMLDAFGLGASERPASSCRLAARPK